MCTSSVAFYPQVYANTDSPPQGKYRNWTPWSSTCNKKCWHCGKNSFFIDQKNHLERFKDMCPEKIKSQYFLYVTAVLIELCCFVRDQSNRVVSFLHFNLGKLVLKIKILLFKRNLLLYPEDFSAWVAFLLSQSIFLSKQKVCQKKRNILVYSDSCVISGELFLWGCVIFVQISLETDSMS